MFEKALLSRSHYFEHVKNLANNDQGRPGDLTWAPAIHGFTLVTHRLAVVEKNLVRGGMLVHLLTEFDDDALSLLRRETYLDRDTSDFRPKLDNLLHVVALDSNGSLVAEPQYFDNGVRLNWRSTNGVAPPINKSSFMYVDEYARLVNPATLCVVGELAEDGDFSVLRSARVALSNEVDEDDAREIKRRREDRAREPIGFALSLMSDSLANLPRAPSPSASDSSQESGPYTQLYMYEDRQHEFRSPPHNPDPRPLAASDYTQDNQPRTPRSWRAYEQYCAMFSPGWEPQYSHFMEDYRQGPFNPNPRSPSPYEDQEGEEGSPPFNHNSRSPSPYEDSEGEEGSSPYRRDTDHEEDTQYEDFLQDHPDGEFSTSMNDFRSGFAVYKGNRPAHSRGHRHWARTHRAELGFRVAFRCSFSSLFIAPRILVQLQHKHLLHVSYLTALASQCMFLYITHGRERKEQACLAILQLADVKSATLGLRMPSDHLSPLRVKMLRTYLLPALMD